MRNVLARRSFLQAAGLAAAGSLVTGPRASARRAEGSASPRPRLLTGCCAYSYRKYLQSGKMTMEDFFLKAVDTWDRRRRRHHLLAEIHGPRLSAQPASSGVQARPALFRARPSERKCANPIPTSVRRKSPTSRNGWMPQSCWAHRTSACSEANSRREPPTRRGWSGPRKP